ncbi:hypothetical protein ABH935_000404 [Catenulispora sp. GAS73]|uniref:hypothetical protein n=1 Tax=Catenulispora sp. GAS73 TaxID=3156269 RepID=UPI003513A991
MHQLAKKTGFSASSWERYLGGRAFAPESVVRGRVWHGAVGSRVSISVAGRDTRSAVVQDGSESTDFVYESKTGCREVPATGIPFRN